MKKLFLALLLCMFMFTPFAFAGGEQPPEEEPPSIQKSMDVPYTGLTLSNYASMDEGTGYMRFFFGLGAGDAAMLWQDLEFFKAHGVQYIKIYINSPGGSATDGMAMANMLENFRKGGGFIEARAYGEIASATVPIFAVCNKRVAQKNTLFMVHPAKITKWGYFMEELKDLDAQRKMMNLIKSNYLNKLADYTKLSAKEWETKMKDTTYFSTEDAKKWGLVDEIE